MKKLIGTTAVLLMATGAFAQSDDASEEQLTEMGLHVTELADESLSKHLDDSHMAVAKSLAYQHAIASNCEAFELDEESNAAEMAYIFDFLGEIEDEESQQEAVLVTMMGYSAYIGGVFAIAAYDYDAFCAHAAEEVESEGDGEHVILVAAE